MHHIYKALLTWPALLHVAAAVAADNAAADDDDDDDDDDTLLMHPLHCHAPASPADRNKSHFFNFVLTHKDNTQ